MHYHNVTKEHFFILVFTSAASKLKVPSFRLLVYFLKVGDNFETTLTMRHDCWQQLFKMLVDVFLYNSFNVRSFSSRSDEFRDKFPRPYARTHRTLFGMSLTEYANIHVRYLRTAIGRACRLMASKTWNLIRVLRVHAFREFRVSSPPRNYFPISFAAESSEDFVNSLISYHQIPKKKKKKLSGLG